MNQYRNFGSKFVFVLVVSKWISLKCDVYDFGKLIYLQCLKKNSKSKLWKTVTSFPPHTNVYMYNSSIYYLCPCCMVLAGSIQGFLNPWSIVPV